MSAGDIITSKGYTFTPEDVELFVSSLVDKIQSTAKDPDQYELVTVLDQTISSLPVFKKTGNTINLVRILMTAFKGDKGDAFTYTDFTPEQLQALALTFEKLTPEQVNTLKIKLADLTPADIASLQKPATDAAAEVRKEMAQISQEVSQTKDALTTSVNDLKAELSTSTAQVIADTNKAKENAISATEVAKSVSDHPGYIGADYHVYTWDYTINDYVKTDTILRPEGFSIFRQYASIALMNADLANVPEGKFVLINTNDVEQSDNAKLYVRGVSSFEYLVDMSGAIGFTGKTPQISIGTVITGTAGGTASASLSPDGTDEDGNPKYKLNLVIPQGIQGFTPELSIGKVTTGQPGTAASVEIIDKGTADSGAPKKELNFTIPTGATGSVEGVYKTQDIDHVPGENDLTYEEAGKTLPFQIGNELRYFDTEKDDYVFYKLFDIKDGKAVWKLAGSGGSDESLVFLSVPETFDTSYIEIKDGGLGGL